MIQNNFESCCFVSRFGETYRLLLRESEGNWLVSWEKPSAPFFVSDVNFSDFKRVATPESFLLETQQEELTDAQRRRFALIEPLLREQCYLTDRKARNQLAAQIAGENKTTSKRVLRLFYRYLATGRLSSVTATEEARHKENPLFDRTIRKYYFSSKRFSLRTAYEMMLVENFTSEFGELSDSAPSWSSFRHYFYRCGYHKTAQKQISREGLTQYQRESRTKFGSASAWRPEPGSFQMDATQADLYLVSRLDRRQVVGRPYIYLAVDTATQLIAGVHVGFDCDETCVMACLAQAAGDKVEFCRKHGIEIKPEEWPNCGLPHEVITDKGRDFWGSRMGELCRRYGMEAQALAPFRPDQKGLVEKAFDLIQSRYKPLLRGKGTIEDDAQERWAVDYRTQAVLNLDEFTQIILHCIIFLNSGRCLYSGKTPAQLWSDHNPQLLDVPKLELRTQALPRQSVKLGQKGIKLNRLQYVPQSAEGLCIGETYTAAYDPEDLSQIFLVLHNEVRSCSLGTHDAIFSGGSNAEASLLRSQLQAQKREGKRQALEASTRNIGAIQAIIQQSAENGMHRSNTRRRSPQ